MRLFHGTTSTHLHSIYRDGIRPRGHASGNWPSAAASRSDCVYLSDAHPLYYAMQTVWREGSAIDVRDGKVDAEHCLRAWHVQVDERRRRKLARELDRQARRREERAVIHPAVIEIDTERLNPFDLIPDEDAIEQSLNLNGAMQHLAPAELLAFVRARVHELAGHHEASLRALGTCAHIGTIPATAITRVAVVDPRKAPELCHYTRINSCNVVTYSEVGAQLRELTRWMFGEAHAHFDGPPESERAGIKITDRFGVLQRYVDRSEQR